MAEQSERRRGESPREYSKRLQQERIDAQLEENDRIEREKQERIERCSHYNCEPTEWHWETGKVREMYCPECEQTKYFEE